MRTTVIAEASKPGCPFARQRRLDRPDEDEYCGHVGLWVEDRCVLLDHLNHLYKYKTQERRQHVCEFQLLA